MSNYADEPIDKSVFHPTRADVKKSEKLEWERRFSSCVHTELGYAYLADVVYCTACGKIWNQGKGLVARIFRIFLKMDLIL